MEVSFCYGVVRHVLLCPILDFDICLTKCHDNLSTLAAA